MKRSYSDGRRVDIPGHHQELLQYLEMVVEPREETLMDASAKRGQLMIVMVMTTDPTDHVVICQMRR